MTNRAPNILNRIQATPGYQELFLKDRDMVRTFGTFEKFLAHLGAVEVEGEKFKGKSAADAGLRCSVAPKGEVQTYGDGPEFVSVKGHAKYSKDWREEFAEWRKKQRAV
jgi:hypothetical protein